MNVSNPAATFARKESGFVRSFSIWTAFLFGVHCISLSSSGFIPFSWVASVWPGASIVGVLTLSMLFCGIHAICFAAIGGVSPFVGADYILASRTLSPRLAFLASWTLVLFSGFVAGGLAAWVPKSAIPALARPLAIISGDSRYQALADFSASSYGTLLLGSAVVLIVTTSVLQSNRFIQHMLSAGFAFGVVAWVVIFWSLASADGPSTFQDAWDKFMGPTSAYGTYGARLPLAQAAGMTLSPSVGTMTLAGLIMGFWIFYGYYIPTFFAEEVKQPAFRTLALGALASLVVSYSIFTAAALMLQRLVPLDWIAAEGFLFNNPGAVAKQTGGISVPAMPWITFYAAVLKPKVILIAVVAFAWVFTLVNLVQTYFFYSSRVMAAWVLDRIVPETIFGPLTPSPVSRPVVVMAALALAGNADAAVGGPLGTQMTFVFFAVVTQIVPVLAVTLLPWRYPRLLAPLPEWLRKRVLGLPVVSLIGGATLLYLAWMIIASFAFPAVGVANPVGTLALLAAFALVGFGVFELMARKRAREGLPVDLRLPRTAEVDADAAGIS